LGIYVLQCFEQLRAAAGVEWEPIISEYYVHD